MSDFNKYLQSIRPTKSGLVVLGLLFIIIPIGVDFFLLPLNAKMHDTILLSSFLLGACIKYIPLLLVYLLVFFLIKALYEKLMEK